MEEQECQYKGKRPINEDRQERWIIVFYLVVGGVLYFIADSLPLIPRRIFVVVVPAVICAVIWGCIYSGVIKGKYESFKFKQKLKIKNQKYDTGWQKETGRSGAQITVGKSRHVGYIKERDEVGFVAAVKTGPFLGIGAVFSVAYMMAGIFWLIYTFFK